MRVMSTDAGMGGAPRKTLLEIEPVLAPENQPGALVRAERPMPPATEQPTLPAIEAAEPPPARKSGGFRKRLLMAAAVVAIAVGGYFAYDWWTNGRFIVSTDDAYVGADSATVGPKIAGYVKTVAVGDNSHVKAGDPLVILDDSDFRIALQQAEAQIASAEATITRIGEQIHAGEAQVGQAQAQIDSAKAAAVNAKATFDRVSALVKKNFASNQELDQARAALTQADSAVAAAEAGFSAAQANVAVANAQKAEAERALVQQKLARDQAQLNLDHTIVRAPYDGVVGNRAAEPGEYVQPGQRLMAVVPMHAVYVDANFKETQLGELKPGQTVAISVDAYPDLPIEGKVESIAPASGAVFSLLPPENATGNFTKIVQRVPVRIRLAGDAITQGLIRPGMSVVASVDTRTAPTSLAAR